MVWTLLQIALGGALGSVLRYLSVSGAARLWGGTFPIGTLLVNVLGCFVMGVLAVWLLGPKGPAPVAPLLIAGFLGGFTTFSAFSLDALKLWQNGLPVQALVYVGASVLFSLAAVALGAALAKGALG